MSEDKENNKEHLTDDEIKVLKNVIERERAITWLSSSAKYIAGWIIIVLGAWAVFSKWAINGLLYLIGQGPIE